MLKQNMSKIAKGMGISRPMRKKLLRLSALPTTRVAAALIPLLAMGFFAARRTNR